jgi:hypothetical protein
MEILPAIEAWRETLPFMRRLRMNHPSAAPKKATGNKRAPDRTRSPQVTVIVSATMGRRTPATAAYEAYQAALRRAG